MECTKKNKKYVYMCVLYLYISCNHYAGIKLLMPFICAIQQAAKQPAIHIQTSQPVSQSFIHFKHFLLYFFYCLWLPQSISFLPDSFSLPHYFKMFVSVVVVVVVVTELLIICIKGYPENICCETHHVLLLPTIKSKIFFKISIHFKQKIFVFCHTASQCLQV